MYAVFLVEGPVGAGKSTFAASLARQHKAVHLNLDDWMARLFRLDRTDLDVMTWYLKRKARFIAQIWLRSRSALHCGVPLIDPAGFFLIGLAHE